METPREDQQARVFGLVPVLQVVEVGRHGGIREVAAPRQIWSAGHDRGGGERADDGST